MLIFIYNKTIRAKVRTCTLENLYDIANGTYRTFSLLRGEKITANGFAVKGVCELNIYFKKLDNKNARGRN